MSQKTSDIVIVGGGLVGLTAALTLSNLGASVIVLETKTELAEHPQGLDARSIALSISSVQMLKSLGLWSGFQSQMSAIEQIHVSSQGHWGISRMLAKQLRLPAIGYVVENTILLEQLFKAANKNENIHLLMGAQFESLKQEEDSVLLNYQQHSNSNSKILKIRAKLVIAADGAISKLRGFLKIDHQQFDYQQSVVIANIEVEKANQKIAYERFSSHGPLAMLPLTGNRYAMVWTDSEAHVDQLVKLDDTEFLSQLQQLFGFRLGYFIAVGRRNSFPLQRIRASQLVSDHCVLLGNAANTLHPVAGQGLNLAFRDIAQLFDTFNQSGTKLNFATIKNQLLEYQQSRLKDHDQVIRFGDGLVELFSNNLPALNCARATALGILDILPVLKTEVTMLGMGFGQAASSLMRGVLPNE